MSSKTLSSFIRLAPPGTKADGALVRYELKGREIAATPPVGSKPAPKDLTLIGLLDYDPTTPLEAADERSYEVLGGSEMTLSKIRVGIRPCAIALRQNSAFHTTHACVCVCTINLC